MTIARLQLNVNVWPCPSSKPRNSAATAASDTDVTYVDLFSLCLHTPPHIPFIGVSPSQQMMITGRGCWRFYCFLFSLSLVFEPSQTQPTIYYVNAATGLWTLLIKPFNFHHQGKSTEWGGEGRTEGRSICCKYKTWLSINYSLPGPADLNTGRWERDSRLNNWSCKRGNYSIQEVLMLNHLIVAILKKQNLTYFIK